MTAAGRVGVRLGRMGDPNNVSDPEQRTESPRPGADATTHHPQSTRGHTPLPRGDAHDLAVLLGPILQRVCDGRLGLIEWFRSAHQRGGAATGFSTWKVNPSHILPVLVKLPVGPCEHRWTASLGTCEVSQWEERWSRALPTPRVIASGTELGGYDLGWLVMERLTGSHLPQMLDESSAHDLLEATADFQAAAIRSAPLTERPKPPEWERTLDRVRELGRAGGFPEAQRWNEAVRKVRKALPRLRQRWESRSINSWCHGDLHPGNALRRASADEGSDRRHGCVLIDLALVHAGHWVEDALYLERQYWGHEKQLGLKPVPTLARLRRDRGLPADDDYGELAMVRRVLMAACAPALLDREGSPRYLHAALEIVERCLPQAAR